MKANRIFRVGLIIEPISPLPQLTRRLKSGIPGISLSKKLKMNAGGNAISPLNRVLFISVRAEFFVQAGADGEGVLAIDDARDRAITLVEQVIGAIRTPVISAREVIVANPS